MNPAPKPKVRKQRKRFSHRRDPEYCDWLRLNSGCVLAGCRRAAAGGQWGIREVAHVCNGPLELMHVKSRGSGGDDVSNVVMGCSGAHGQQHTWGTRTFEDRWSVNLAQSARDLYAKYLSERV